MTKITSTYELGISYAFPILLALSHPMQITCFVADSFEGLRQEAF
jgi:hypothetical protein